MTVDRVPLSSPVDDQGTWPSLPLADWQDTHDTLHMWLQIVGKTRLALAPRQNHWWHVPLYVSSRGLTTTPIPYGSRSFEVEFDFIDHRLVVETSEGTIRQIGLRAQAVADFYREYTEVLAGLGIVVTLWPVPVEVDHPIPFLEDRLHASYDSAQAHRFFRILLQADRIMKRFQGRFLGKTSPVHFFWGAFDLALTRFSGRRASHKDTDSWMLREANSHEEISVGFWPGSGTVAESRPFGGTCALRGCVPKKILVSAAEAVHAARDMADKGVPAPTLAIDWDPLIRFKRSLVDPTPQRTEQ